MDRIRVLIADDHPLIIVGLTTALSDLGIEVVQHVAVASEVIPKYAAGIVIGRVQGKEVTLEY